MRRVSSSRSRTPNRRPAAWRRLEVLQLEDRLPPGDVLGLGAGGLGGAGLLRYLGPEWGPSWTNAPPTKDAGPGAYRDGPGQGGAGPKGASSFGDTPSKVKDFGGPDGAFGGNVPAASDRAWDDRPWSPGGRDGEWADALLLALGAGQGPAFLPPTPTPAEGGGTTATASPDAGAPARDLGANERRPLENQAVLEAVAGWGVAAAGQPAPPAGRVSAAGTGLNVTLVADTNRDGTVTDADLEGRADWTAAAGAIFAVNYDDDDGNGQPDAISFNDQGRPFNENFVIENAADAQELAPLVIKALGPAFDPATMQVYLSTASLEDAQSIHVFPSLNPGATSVLGGAGSRVLGGAPAGQFADVTTLVSATDDVTFGVEGLLFRNTNAGPLEFDGQVDLAVSVYQGNTLLSSDAVRLKVAPWIMAVHTQASERIYAANAGALNASFLSTSAADPGYFGLNSSGQLFTYAIGGSNNQWTQDHGEFGYTERPGGPKTYVFFRLPYYRGVGSTQPTWPTALLAPGVGIFQLGINLSPLPPPATQVGAGDYGGNLEALPPTASYPLGRTILGNSGSSALFTFLQSQEAQASLQLPTRWLGVSHLDEIIGFTPNPGEVLIADPVDAYLRLNNIPAEERGGAVFFATGAKPQTATVTASATATRIDTGIDHRGQTWQYLRVYDSSASGSNAAGQVARVAPGGLQNGYILIDRVWDTTSKIVDPAGGPSAMRWLLTADAPFSGGWFNAPRAGDKLVLVEGTRFWSGNVTPSFVTVQEVLADNELHALNTIDYQGILDGIRTTLDNAAGGPGSLTFIKVPVLYVGLHDRNLDGIPDFATNRSASAFTTGLQNFQPLGAEQYFPRQFGPLSETGTYAGQVSFGTDGGDGVVNFTVTGSVGPASPAQYRDDGDVGFRATGAWAAAAGDGYRGDFQYAEAGAGGSTATWTFAGLPPGQYRLSATWAPGDDRATNAPFTVRDGSTTLATALVNQQLAPADFSDGGVAWQDLGGAFTLGNGTLTVTLTNSADGRVVADGLRAERLAPEVQVLDGTVNLPDNSGVADFGTTTPGAPLARTFTVQNVGTANLTLGGAVSVPAGFELASGFGATTLAPGASTTFTVRLAAAAAGTYGGGLSFRSNDYDEDPFNIILTGAVAAGGPAVRIVDDGDAEFTASAGFLPYPGLGYQDDSTYAAPGVGDEYAAWYLTGLAPGSYRVSATWAADPGWATNAPFSLFDGKSYLGDSLVDQTSAPGDFTADGAAWKDLGTFSVSSGTLAVYLLNAADGYVAADAIRVERLGGPSGGPSLQVLDGTTEVPDNNGLVDFGNTAPGVSLAKTFTVRNVGTATVNLVGAVRVPAGYSLVSGFGTTTLAPGQETTFTVRLNAAAVDILEYAARSQFDNPRFVDCWDLYHRLLGEVHCGTVVRRQPFAFNWWDSLPG